MCKTETGVNGRQKQRIAVKRTVMVLLCTIDRCFTRLKITQLLPMKMNPNASVLLQWCNSEMKLTCCYEIFFSSYDKQRFDHHEFSCYFLCAYRVLELFFLWQQIMHDVSGDCFFRSCECCFRKNWLQPRNKNIFVSRQLQKEAN